MLPGHRRRARTPSSTPAALDAVRAGDADYACVPIENSIEGSVLPTLDSLAFGHAAAGLRRAHAGRRVQHRRRRATRPPPTCAPSRRSRSPPRRSGAGWPRTCRTPQSFRPTRMRRRQQDVAARPRRRRGEHRAGRRTLRAGHPGRRRRRRAERPHPLRARRSAGPAAASAPAPTGRRWCCGWTTSPAPWCRR